MSNVTTTPRPQLVQTQADVTAAPKIYRLLEHTETLKKLKAVATSYLPAERAIRLMINAVRKTPRLAECDPYSVFGAMMTAHALGLEANTVLGHAYLIPFKKSVPRVDSTGKKVTDSRGKWIWDEAFECQFQIGYKGYVALAYRQPEIRDLTAEAIREGDDYQAQKGTDTFLRYAKSLTGERGDIIGAFCFTKLSDGQAFTDLTQRDLEKIRARSETWKALASAVEKAENEKDRAKAQAKLAETPWVMWDDAMSAKSAIKTHCKQLSLSPLMAAAAEIDSAADEGRLDMNNLSDPDFLREALDGSVDFHEQGADDDHKQIDQSSEPTINTVDTGKGDSSKAPAEASRTSSKAAPKQQAAVKPAPQGEPQAGASGDQAPAGWDQADTSTEDDYPGREPDGRPTPPANMFEE
jgi:recombination protein RecT